MSFPFPLKIRSLNYNYHQPPTPPPSPPPIMFIADSLEKDGRGIFGALMSRPVTPNWGFEQTCVLFMDPTEEWRLQLPPCVAFGPENSTTNFQMCRTSVCLKTLGNQTVRPSARVYLVCLVTLYSHHHPSMDGLCFHYYAPWCWCCLHLFFALSATTKAALLAVYAQLILRIYNNISSPWPGWSVANR